MSKYEGHTEGKWWASCVNNNPNGCHCGYIFGGGGDKTIAKVIHNDPDLPDHEHLEDVVTLVEKNANQRLLADAPRLLRRIGRLHRWLREKRQWILHVEGQRDRYNRELMVASTENWRLRKALELYRDNAGLNMRWKAKDALASTDTQEVKP